MNQTDEQITSVEQRVSALESQATASACTHEVEETEAIKCHAREAIVIANDVEQYTRRNNIRVRGLAVPESKDCKDVIINFLSNKLRIRNVTHNDTEAAHILPTRNNRETGSHQRGSLGPNGDGSESGHTDPNDMNDTPKSIAELDRKVRLGRGRKKALWTEISEQLSVKFGKLFSAKHVGRKWQTLVDGYKKAVQNNNNNTGRAPSRFARLKRNGGYNW